MAARSTTSWSMRRRAARRRASRPGRRRDFDYTYRHSDAARGRGGRRRAVRGRAGRSRRDRRRDGPDRRRARGVASRCAAKTGGSTFKNPPGTQGLGAGRRGRLPRADASATRRSARSTTNFLINTRRRDQRRHRGAGRGSAAARARDSRGVELRMGNPAGGAAPVTADRKLHVAVLMGGWSTERAVSLIERRGRRQGARERSATASPGSTWTATSRAQARRGRSPTSCSTRSTARPARTARCRA